MIIKVEATWNGTTFGFRLTIPGNHRETLRGSEWTRKLATEALDLLEHVYGFNRRNIRFQLR